MTKMSDFLIDKLCNQLTMRHFSTKEIALKCCEFAAVVINFVILLLKSTIFADGCNRQCLTKPLQ